MYYYNLFLLLAVVHQLDLFFIHTRQSVVDTNIKQTFPYISPTHLIKGGGGFPFLLLTFPITNLPLLGWYCYFVNEC